MILEMSLGRLVQKQERREPAQRESPVPPMEGSRRFEGSQRIRLGACRRGLRRNYQRKQNEWTPGRHSYSRAKRFTFGRAGRNRV